MHINTMCNYVDANLLTLVNPKAVVLMLCNTLVLYCKTLACGVCMHAFTATVYLNSKVADWNSMSGNAIWLHANMLARVNYNAVALVLCNTLVLYCKTLACACWRACRRACVLACMRVFVCVHSLCQAGVTWKPIHKA